MSLFDLIRHPIHDIYDHDQLTHIQPFILDTWVSLCATDAGIDLRGYVDSLSRFAVTGTKATVLTIKWCVNRRVLNHNLRTMSTSDILTGFEVKMQYTKILRDLIYENEYYED